MKRVVLSKVKSDYNKGDEVMVWHNKHAPRIDETKVTEDFRASRPRATYVRTELGTIHWSTVVARADYTPPAGHIDASRLRETEKLAHELRDAQRRVDDLRSQLDERLFRWQEEGVPISTLAGVSRLSRETIYKSIDRHYSQLAR
jgi:hypothetical protein